jgi:hypothetical protein
VFPKAESVCEDVGEDLRVSFEPPSEEEVTDTGRPGCGGGGGRTEGGADFIFSNVEEGTGRQGSGGKRCEGF